MADLDKWRCPICDELPSLGWTGGSSPEPSHEECACPGGSPFPLRTIGATMTTFAFETTTDKLAAIRALNDLLRSAGKAAVHEGLSEDDPLYKVFVCVADTPVRPA